MTNKCFILFLISACCLVIVGCFFDGDVEKKIDGQWNFSLKRTVEYKNPSEKIDENSAIAIAMNKSYLMIDSNEKIVRTDINSGKDESYRYRVIKKEKDSLIFSFNDTVEVFEIMKDGSLLMCPLNTGLKNCLVFVKGDSKNN